MTSEGLPSHLTIICSRLSLFEKHFKSVSRAKPEIFKEIHAQYQKQLDDMIAVRYICYSSPYVLHVSLQIARYKSVMTVPYIFRQSWTPCFLKNVLRNYWMNLTNWMRTLKVQPLLGNYAQRLYNTVHDIYHNVKRWYGARIPSMFRRTYNV